MRLGNEKNYASKVLYCSRLSLYLNNIGCVSAMKKIMQANFFALLSTFAIFACRRKLRASRIGASHFRASRGVERKTYIA